MLGVDSAQPNAELMVVTLHVGTEGAEGRLRASRRLTLETKGPSSRTQRSAVSSAGAASIAPLTSIQREVRHARPSGGRIDA